MLWCHHRVKETGALPPKYFAPDSGEFMKLFPCKIFASFCFYTGIVRVLLAMHLIPTSYI